MVKNKHLEVYLKNLSKISSNSLLSNWLLKLLMLNVLIPDCVVHYKFWQLHWNKNNGENCYQSEATRYLKFLALKLSESGFTSSYT